MLETGKSRIRELILELVSEVVLAAPPSTLPTEASVTNTKKHSQTGGNSRDFFLGLFEHLHVLCLKKHAETATKSVKLPPPVWGGGRAHQRVFPSELQKESAS